MSVIEEVGGIMGYTLQIPVTIPVYTIHGFNPHNLIDRSNQKGGKQKAAAALTCKNSQPKPKRQNGEMFKNVNVIKYMVPETPQV